MVYINKGGHGNPHELPKENSKGSLNAVSVYTHTKSTTTLPEEIEKLEYIHQHFQDCKKIHETDPHLLTEQIDDTVHVPKLVIHIIMITTYLTQDHSVHTYMITYHDNLTH